MFLKLADKPGYLEGLLATVKKALNALGGQIQETEGDGNGFKNLSLADLAGAFLASHEAETGEDSSAASELRKKPHLKALTLSAIFALLTAYFGFTAFKLALPPSKRAPVPDSLTSQIDFQLERLQRCAGELDVAWTQASDKVKKAFVYYYTPGNMGGAAGLSSQALNPHTKLIEGVAGVTPQAKTGNEEGKKKHLRKLQFASYLCDAAQQRIRGLNILDTHGEIPALILGRQEGKMQHPPGKAFTFKNLLKMLKEKDIEYRPPTQPSDLPLPGELVLQFAGLMLMAHREMQSDRFVREQFGGYLQEVGRSLETLTPKDLEGLSKFQMPGDTTPFDAQEFFEFLHKVYTSTGAKDAQKRWLDTLAKSWNEASLKETIQKFKEAHSKQLLEDLQRKQEKLSQARKKGNFPLTHTFALSTFLI